MNHLDALLATKTFSSAPQWKSDGRGQFRFSTPLIIDGVVQEGLFLMGRAPESTPGRDVTFTLCNGSPRAKPDTIDRIDWNPSTGHVNRNIGPEGLRLLVVEGTHRHYLEDNLTQQGVLRTGNLPIARPIEENLNSFGSLVDYVEKAYNIGGLSYLAPPLWTEDLFG